MCTEQMRLLGTHLQKQTGCVGAAAAEVDAAGAVALEPALVGGHVVATPPHKQSQRWALQAALLPEQATAIVLEVPRAAMMMQLKHEPS